MITVDQIRSVLKQFAASDISLDAFDEWLTTASWNMHKDSLPDAVKVVGSIELYLAECDYSDKDAATIAAELMALLPTVQMTNVAVLVSISTAGNICGETFTPPLILWAGADKPREKVFGSSLLSQA